jgi:hypothetical protein
MQQARKGLLLTLREMMNILYCGREYNFNVYFK